MTSEVTQALLPCPFCGGEAERFTLPEDEFGNGGGDVITCSWCQASSHVEFGRKENLVDRWNARLTAQSGESERDIIAKWHRSKAETLRSLATMNLPAVSPVIAREKARWHEEAANCIELGEHQEAN